MLLRPRAHRVIDYLTVAAFAVAPAALHLDGTPAALSYVLAAVHLGLTLATAFPGGARRPVPIAAHALAELGVGIVLLVVPWFIGWDGAARTFFVSAGAVILAVWIVSSYSERDGARRRPAHRH
jgi:hypothetical protein